MLTCQHPTRACFYKLQKIRRRRLAVCPQTEARSIALHGGPLKGWACLLTWILLLPFITVHVSYYQKLLEQQITIYSEKLNSSLVHCFPLPHTQRKGESRSTPSLLGTAPSPLASTHFSPPFSPILPITLATKLKPTTEPLHYMSPLGRTAYGMGLDAFLWKTKHEPWLFQPALPQPWCPSYHAEKGRQYPSVILAIHLILLSLNASRLD